MWSYTQQALCSGEKRDFALYCLPSGLGDWPLIYAGFCIWAVMAESEELVNNRLEDMEEPFPATRHQSSFRKGEDVLIGKWGACR